MSIGKQLRDGFEIDNVLFVLAGAAALFFRERWGDQTAGTILCVALIAGGVTRWVIPGFRHLGLALMGAAFVAAGVVALVNIGPHLAGFVLLPAGVWMAFMAVKELRAEGTRDDSSPPVPPAGPS